MLNCPICKHNKTRQYFSNGKLTLFYCNKCKVKFQHPMPTAEFLSQLYSAVSYFDVSGYAEKFLPEQKLLFHDRLKALERINCGKKGKVLDIGSGHGMFLEAAKERGWTCVGQEFSIIEAEKIRNRLNIDMLECRDFVDAKLPFGNFDLVHANHILEHLFKPTDVIKKIYDMLKPGGIFYCEIPRQSNLQNYVSNFFAKNDLGVDYLPEHLFIFDEKTLSFLFKNVGFEILYSRIEGIGNPHRYVYGIHYTSFWTHIITKVIETFKLQRIIGGGNLVLVSRKPYSN